MKISKTNLIILLIFIFIIGLIIGSYLFLPKPLNTNAHTIYEKLQNQGFLVSQTYIFDQKIEIDNTSGQIWKDVFWGQNIKANALMKVNLGVDLQKLQKQNITVLNNEINIVLPQPQIHSTELISDINLENKQGLLKIILDNDDGYNQALNLLKEQAEITAKDKKIIAETKISTSTEVNRLLELIVPNKKINISFK